jgi:hypothetical protein
VGVPDLVAYAQLGHGTHGELLDRVALGVEGTECEPARRKFVLFAHQPGELVLGLVRFSVFVLLLAVPVAGLEGEARGLLLAVGEEAGGEGRGVGGGARYAEAQVRTGRPTNARARRMLLAKVSSGPSIAATA